MKNTLFFILIILISIFSYLLFSSLIDWTGDGKLEVTAKDIRDALILGIIIPTIILVSRKVKNKILIVFLAIVMIILFLFVSKYFFKV